MPNDYGLLQKKNSSKAKCAGKKSISSILEKTLRSIPPACVNNRWNKIYFRHYSLLLEDTKPAETSKLFIKSFCKFIVRERVLPNGNNLETWERISQEVIRKEVAKRLTSNGRGFVQYKNDGEPLWWYWLMAKAASIAVVFKTVFSFSPVLAMVKAPIPFIFPTVGAIALSVIAVKNTPQSSQIVQAIKAKETVQVTTIEEEHPRLKSIPKPKSRVPTIPSPPSSQTLKISTQNKQISPQTLLGRLVSIYNKAKAHQLSDTGSIPKTYSLRNHDIVLNPNKQTGEICLKATHKHDNLVCHLEFTAAGEKNIFRIEPPGQPPRELNAPDPEAALYSQLFEDALK